MDASDSVERTRLNVLELARNLYSHDAELLAGAVDKAFASNATYAGHGLKISGASRIKHAAALNNAIDVGSAPELSAEDVEWDESSKTATLSTVRYVSPRGMPLFSFAIPVRTVLHFGGPSKSLQVTHIAEEWPLDAFLQRTPVVGTLERTIFTPLATLAFVQLAGIYHALSSHLSSTSRKLVEPTAAAAKVRVPAGVERGFVRGTEVAQGWGSGLVERAVNLSEAPLRALERAAQTSTSILSRVSPIELPTPFIYQAPERKRPASSSQSNGKKEEKSESKDDDAKKAEKPEQDESAAAEEQPAAATVQVSATAEEPAKEISIPARVNNEAPQAEATTQLEEPKAADAPKETLFDRIEVPDLTTGHAASQKPQGHLLAVPTSPNVGGGHSSGSEEEHEHDDEERKTGGGGGAGKKSRRNKKKKSKKDKDAAAAPAAAHEKPPTFKESLQS